MNSHFFVPTALGARDLLDLIFHYSLPHIRDEETCDLSQAALQNQKGITLPCGEVDSRLIEHRLIYPASSLYFFETLVVGALAPPAIFAGVSVATFLAPLAAAGARAALGGAPPFVYDRGKDR